MRKLILFVFIFAFCAAVVSAADFDVEIGILKDKITTDEAAQFLVTVHNYNDAQETFRVYSPEVEWAVLPLTIVVSGKKTESGTVRIVPSKYINPGMYGVKVYIERESTGEVEKKLVFISVQEPRPEGYVPAVKMEVDMLSRIDPRELVTIKVNLENLNVLNLTNVTLKVTSDLPAFNREQLLSINAFEKKVVELTYKLEPAQQPKKYKLWFELIRNNKIIANTEPRAVEVLAVIPEFTREISEKGIFLKTTKTIKVTSTANVRNTQLVKLETSALERIFTSTEPDARVIEENGKRYLAWDVELGPGESAELEATVNYRILLYAIVIALIFFMVYSTLKSPLIVKKSISSISTLEGGISSLKVLIDIKNKGKKTLRDLVIHDIVPNIAEIVREWPDGTVRPVSILPHRKSGTIVKWTAAELGPKEELLIAYDIKSKLSILGQFRMPRARVRYIRNGKEGFAYSNSVGVSA